MADSAAWDAEITARVRVIVHNPDVIERVTGPNAIEWRSQFYDLRSPSDVIEHLAYNYVRNGVDDITRLDGWADCDAEDVTFEMQAGDVFSESEPVPA